MKDTFDEIIGKVLMHSHDAGDISGLTSYTDEQAQDAVGGILDDGTLDDIAFVYDDATPKIKAHIKPKAGTVTYTGNKITRIVKGSTTYDYTYIGNKLNTITDGTTVWTILYLGNKISGWTI